MTTTLQSLNHLQSLLEQSQSTSRPTLILLHASWCHFSQKALHDFRAPAWDKETQGQLLLATAETDTASGICDYFNTHETPTFVFILPHRHPSLTLDDLCFMGSTEEEWKAWARSVHRRWVRAFPQDVSP